MQNPTTNRVDIELSVPQSRAYPLAMSPRVDLNLEWGRGTGKSWFDRLCAWLWVARADGKPRRQLLEELGINTSGMQIPLWLRGVRILFLMPTLKQFKEVNGAPFRSELHDWGHLGPRLNGTDFSIAFPGGSFIRPYASEEHVAKRGRGPRADIVICDEADDTPVGVFEKIVRPWFTEPWSLKIRITSGTFTKGRSGLLYQRRLAGRDPNKPRYHTFHATYRDCPELVDPEEVEDARANTPTLTFLREWECDPASAEGLVYGGVFDEKFHIRERPENVVWTDILIGCDHGYDHPGCLLLIGVKGKGDDAVAWVLDEVYQRHKVSDWWEEALSVWTEMYPRHRFYGDPSEPQTIEGYRLKCGARVQDTDNSVQEGIKSVQNLFFIRTKRDEDGKELGRFARLFISPRCINLLAELGVHHEDAIVKGQYRRKPDPNDPDAYTDEVIKLYDEACDALRYPIFNYFGPAPWSRQASRNMDQMQ